MLRKSVSYFLSIYLLLSYFALICSDAGMSVLGAAKVPSCLLIQPCFNKCRNDSLSLVTKGLKIRAAAFYLVFLALISVIFLFYGLPIRTFFICAKDSL
jgi:hypothetical protein